MSERWKPERGEIYYFVDSTCDVSDCEWLDDSVDRLHYKNGNCFSSEEKAKTFAKRVKDLLLGLQCEKSEQLPTLTTDIFRHPECPEWARYAYVGCLGIPVVCENMPEKVSGGHYRNSESGRWDIFKMTGRFSYFDNNNEHYYIERPAKLPKLTSEVFDREDCPEWAQYAAVDEDGTAVLFEHRPEIAPIGRWWDRRERYCSICKTGGYDATDWQNSMIERPVKLPDWCKVDAMGWHKRCGYFKITYIDDVSKRVDIQQVEDRSEGYLSFHTVCNETVQARLRPYNADEMKALVGKVVTTSSGRHCTLVTACKQEYSSIQPQVMLNKWLYATDLLNGGNTIDGKPCGKLEHLENGEWVE